LAAIDQRIASGDARRAEIQLGRLLRDELDPVTRSEILVRRARARLLLSRPDEALVDMHTALDLAPDLLRLNDMQCLLGDIHLLRFELAAVGFAERTDTDRALQAYQTIMQRDPLYANSGWVLYQWGRLLLSRDQMDEAYARFSEALLNPTTSAVVTAYCHERLGFIELVERRDPAAALVQFNRAAIAYPREAPLSWMVRLHLHKARALREQTRFDEAAEAALTARRLLKPLDPEYRALASEVSLMLGETLAKTPGNEREAVEYLSQFLQLSRKPQGIDVTWSRVHETIGELWFQVEAYDAAIEAYRQALAYNPYHPLEVLVNYQIARANFRRKEYREAIAFVNAMLKAAESDGQSVTDYRVYSMLASAYFALGNFAQAAEAYKQALHLAPPNAEQRDEISTYLQSALKLARRQEAGSTKPDQPGGQEN
jgi:tetratricopeptide (TPR) repeat protein